MNIHRQASIPSHSSLAAPPAWPENQASARSEEKMPTTIASCWREPRRPRTLAGETSAM